MNKLFEPISIKNLKVKNRLVMAPMTRSRAGADGVPTKLMSKYYTQRTSFGLIISEGTQPSAVGQGYPLTPGIYTLQQVAGWRTIFDSVHQAGGAMYLQLMHVGRMSHPDNTGGLQAVAPSAIAPGEEIFTAAGLKEIPLPRALTNDEIKQTIADFRHAAACAIEAGADGVEIHSANGYLLHQFLGANSNQRTDEYGGSIENRARLTLEVVQAVADQIGAERTGVRISPMNHLGNVDEGPDGTQLYRYLVSELAANDLAYLHVMNVGYENLLKEIRLLWPNTLIVNRPSRPLDKIAVDVENGNADMVSVGTWALANPDFTERLKAGAPLNTPIKELFYGQDGEHGYTDYPKLPESK